MNQQLDTASREQQLEAAIIEMQSVNKKIAKLTMRKEELTQIIIAALGHNKEGQATYEYNEYKVTCKTPYTFSLDKKAYESGAVFLPGEFDPIKTAKSYTVDKKLYEKYMATSPEAVRESLTALVTIKPGKASITIGNIA